MRRRQRGHDITFSEFKAFTFGSAGELIAVFGDLARAEQRWEEVRETFLERWDLWGRPEAWWRFEPGIPEALRTGPSAVITYGDAEVWNQLDRDRRAYLESIGIDPEPDRSFTAFGTD